MPTCMSTPTALIEIPGFTLHSSVGGRISRTDYLGQVSVVMVFLPDLKASLHALLPFQDHLAEFGLAKCQVLAVASELVSTVREFADRHNLEIPLLADESGEIARELNLESACHPVVLVADRDCVVRESVTFPNVHIEGVLDRVRRIGEA
ncbi:MAG: hypothetical protein DWQ20_02455 [Actinobacteria bacterium]|nr:MAG: hypothetical protein DWQ20_02455 [Actinomycetota bacterium]